MITVKSGTKNQKNELQIKRWAKLTQGTLPVPTV